MSRHGHRFFVEQQLSVGSSLSLPERQSRQIASVLRLRAGDRVGLFNGDGTDYDASIVEISRSGVTVVIGRSEPGIRLPKPSIHLALAMIKTDRFEWALQKVTELGVERVTPMTTERSVISLRVDREDHRRQRWLRIAVEASEQSGRCTVPEVTRVASFADVVSDVGTAQFVLLSKDEATSPLTTMTFDVHLPLVLAVGPEGGFSPSEIEMARKAGARTASLGRLTLRSETAAEAAVAMLVGRELSRAS